MQRLILLGFAILLAAVCVPGRASGDMPPADKAPPQVTPPEPTFSRGQVLSHGLPVCLILKDALEIVKLDVEQGMEAAKALFAAKEKCAGVAVSGPMVGRVVHSAGVIRDGKKVTVKVVEILGADNKVMAYFFTTAVIAASVVPVDPKTRRTV